MGENRMSEWQGECVYQSRLCAPSAEREEAVYLARIAEQAERYEDMAQYMRMVVERSENCLNVVERTLLSIAFKNVVGARRASVRVIDSLFNKEEERKDKGEGPRIPRLSNYRCKVQEELRKICVDVLKLLDDHLIPCIGSGSGGELTDADELEPKVFYLKMKADYYRYLADAATGNDELWVECAGNAEEAYQLATKAADGMAVTHPIRLGLALNFSAFLYEVQQKQTQACDIAKQAFGDAMSELDNLNEESYKDAVLFMQLLRDNLTQWTADDE